MSADEIFSGAGVSYFAPLETPLPATALISLNAAFESAGEITEEGLTVAFEVAKQVFRNWEGKPVKVKTLTTSFRFTLKFYEDNALVKELFYGQQVEPTNGSTSKIAIGSAEDVGRAAVIHVTDGDKQKRFALSEVYAGERSEFQIAPGQAGYQITFHAVVDETGVAGYELFDTDLTAT